eukprot:EG_transcript_5666
MTDVMGEQPWVFEEDSPRAVYAAKCDELRCRKNSHLMRALPGAVQWDSLTEMDLSWNFVGRVGVLPVLEVVRRSPNIIKLSLANNFLNNDSVREIVTHLVDHRCLGHLDLSRNPISHAAGKLLSRFAVQSPRLHTVLLEETLINPALVRIIQRNAAEKTAGRPASRRSLPSTPAPLAATGASPSPAERRDTPTSVVPSAPPKVAAEFARREFVGNADTGQHHQGVELLTEAGDRPGSFTAGRPPPAAAGSGPPSPTTASAGGPPQRGEMLNLVFSVVQAAEPDAEAWQGLPSLWKVAKEDMPNTITSQLEDGSTAEASWSPPSMASPTNRGAADRRASLQPYAVVRSRSNSAVSDSENAGCYMAGIDYASIAADRLQAQTPELEFFALRTFTNLSEQLTGGVVARNRLFSFEFASEDPLGTSVQLEEKTNEANCYMAGIDYVSIAAGRMQDKDPAREFFGLTTFATLAEQLVGATGGRLRSFSIESTQSALSPESPHSGGRARGSPPQSPPYSPTSSALGSPARLWSTDTVEPLPCDAAVGTVTFLCDCVEDGGAGLDLPALQLLGASALTETSPWYALNILWELADREQDPDGDDTYSGLRCVMSLVQPDI